jgi:hypothetical protein
VNELHNKKHKQMKPLNCPLAAEIVLDTSNQSERRFSLLLHLHCIIATTLTIYGYHFLVQYNIIHNIVISHRNGLTTATNFFVSHISTVLLSSFPLKYGHCPFAFSLSHFHYYHHYHHYHLIYYVCLPVIRWLID